MIKIQNAILHIFDVNTNVTLLSQHPLDFKQPYIKNYIEVMIDKIMGTGKQKNGILAADNRMNQQLQNLLTDFVAESQNLTTAFFDLTKVNPDIPSSDLLWIQFEKDEFQFIGMFKLNHSESFTHFVDYDQDMLRNDLIIHHAILPNAKQSIDEGMLFCPATNEYFLIEKKHLLEELAERQNYLSEIFLGIQTVPNMQDNLNIVKKAVQKTAKQFLEPEYEALAVAKAVLYHEVSEAQEIDNHRLAEQMYGDNFAKKQAYFEQTEQLGLADQSAYEPHLMSTRMQKQKLKLDNGIEITIPLALYNDPNTMEIKNNPDGTISVLLKNIDNIKNLF